MGVSSEVEEYITAAADVLVGAAGTEAWDSARAEFGEVLVRENRVGEVKVRRWLDELAGRAEGTDPGERAEILSSERHYWFARLRDLAADEPAIVEELRTVVARLKERAPAEKQEWVQHNVAKDNSRLFATQHGNIIFHGEPPEA